MPPFGTPACLFRGGACRGRRRFQRLGGFEQATGEKQATNERMRVVLVSAAGVPESGAGFRADSKDIRQVVA